MKIFKHSFFTLEPDKRYRIGVYNVELNDKKTGVIVTANDLSLSRLKNLMTPKHGGLFDSESDLPVVKIKEHKAAKKRRPKNPVPMGKIAKATKRYENFRDRQSKTMQEWDSPDFSVGVEVGTLDAILYTTKRGKKMRLEHYEHEFAKGARPILAVTEDGKNLFSLGGNFTFTERGFCDFE